MTLFLKLVWSSWRIQCLVFLKFLVVRVSGKSFLNEGLEYCHFVCAFIAKFSEPSLRFLLMYMPRKKDRVFRGDAGEECFVKGVGERNVCKVSYGLY